MALEFRQHDPRRRPTPRLAIALAALVALSGCQTGPLAAWRTGRDDSLSKGPTKEELGDDRGLFARWMTPKATPHTDPTKNTALVLGPNGWQPPKVTPNPEAEAELKAADALLRQGKHDEAETAYSRIAKNRKATPWGEKARFQLAESQFERGKFVTAHESFEKLIAEYPATEFLDKAINREYAIALNWLALYDPNAKPEQKLPWSARFDGRRPMIDTNGHAIQALEHVRHHDPSGPLADDAVMMIADQYMAVGDYETAAIHYDQLVTDHAKSPYLQRAQLASIDARIKGYIGPEYDGTGLEKAREMIKQTMATFPDRPAGNEKLYHTLDLINDQEAERAYNYGAFYRRTGKITAAEYYFGKIPQRWPKSPWAAKAKEQLATLAKMPRTQSLPSKMFTRPGTTDPFSSSNGMGGMGMGGMGPGMGMGGMGMGAPGGMM
jgi:outer membrane protein assembly factor BamD (BamD/ComL family)